MAIPARPTLYTAFVGVGRTCRVLSSSRLRPSRCAPHWRLTRYAIGRAADLMQRGRTAYRPARSFLRRLDASVLHVLCRGSGCRSVSRHSARMGQGGRAARMVGRGGNTASGREARRHDLATDQVPLYGSRAGTGFLWPIGPSSAVDARLWPGTRPAIPSGAS